MLALFQTSCATHPAPERVKLPLHAKSQAPLAHTGAAFAGAAMHAVSTGAYEQVPTLHAPAAV